MSTTPEPTPADVPPVPDVSPVPDVPPVPSAPAADLPTTDLPTADGPVTESPTTEAAGPTTSAPKTERDQPDLRPLYAVAGLTEMVVDALRHTLADTQHWASARISELRFRQAELEKQAAELRERAPDLPEQVKTLPEVTRSRVGELQQQATHTYADLAGRGQRVVGRVDPVFDRVQESVDRLRRLVTGRASTAPAPEPGTADIIVPAPTQTLDADDDLTSTPAGVPDEALVAEEVYLAEGAEPETMADDANGRREDDGEATSQR
jgi:hypothetical protein